MALTFYYDDASQPCRAVHVMLDVNNIPYEGVYVSLGKGRPCPSLFGPHERGVPHIVHVLVQ